ncbi:uncharacterized protein LOC135810918 isoform X1 [Sycon ciliatum]|uniref:uncharacterized protein LOC135810918 isoform X1 n=1 Tax=Sycon ciliatum TaxID=27933 RepID=UPI0031F6325E
MEPRVVLCLLLLSLCGRMQCASEQVAPTADSATGAAAASASTTRPDIPGHGEPLGQHRLPEIPIDEFSEPITGEVFFKNYIQPQKPVAFRGFAKQWPAFSRWTDETLSQDFGSLEVKIEAKKDGSVYGPEGSLGIGRDTIGNFVEGYKERDKYIVSELPSPMYKDVLVHPSMCCGELNRSVVEVDLWLSSGGTRSRLHRDAFNAINCLLDGTKTWIMIDNNQTKNVYFVADSRYEMGGLSPIDVDNVDLKKFRRFRDVKYGVVEINAGDCVFIPGGHYHQVKSTGNRNLAVSLLFGRVDKFTSGEECKSVPLVAKSLDEFDVLWRWSGTGIMDMGRGDDYFFKVLFTNRMPGNVTELGLKAIAKMLVKDLGLEMDRSTLELSKKVLELLDHDKNGAVSVADLDSVDRHVYRNLSFLIEGESDLMNTYNFEFGSLEYHTLRDTLEALLIHNIPAAGVSREEFIKVYRTEPLRGSQFNGNKLFNMLDKDGDGIIKSKEVTPAILEARLRPYEVDYEGTGGRQAEEEEEEQEEGRGGDDDEGEEEDEEGGGEGEEEEDEGEGRQGEEEDEQGRHDEL